MNRVETKKRFVIGSLLLLSAVAAYMGARFVPRLLVWRHLDQTYQEQFPSPAEIAPELEGKKIVFHIKTGLDQDDSQICVGFNVIFAALEARSDVTVLFDAGALLDLTPKKHNLESTSVPLRLKKVISAQVHVPLDQMPDSYGQYLDLLHHRGANVYANLAMLIVTGDAEKVKQNLPGYAFIEPVTYAGVARLLSQADAVIVY